MSNCDQAYEQYGTDAELTGRYKDSVSRAGWEVDLAGPSEVARGDRTPTGGGRCSSTGKTSRGLVSRRRLTLASAGRDRTSPEWTGDSHSPDRADHCPAARVRRPLWQLRISETGDGLTCRAGPDHSGAVRGFVSANAARRRRIGSAFVDSVLDFIKGGI